MYSNRDMQMNQQAWMSVWIAALIVVIGWYLAAVGSAEGYADYLEGSRVGVTAPDGVAPEVAEFGQNPAVLGDFLPVAAGLTGYSADSVAAVDASRQLEPGGQYLQRTNNYRRAYPDNGSAPLSEMVGSIYGPKDAVGSIVPCAGECY